MISIVKNSNLLNFGTLTFVFSIALFIAYTMHNKPRIKSSEITSTSSDVNSMPVQTDNSLEDSIVNFGMEFLGTPYVAAGCSIDGFDCSGFVYFVFQHFNPHCS